jgi:hypothetical protein
MKGKRTFFQQSRIRRMRFRPSWRNALGWGSILLDFTLALLLPDWRLGFLILPVWLMLYLTRKPGSSPAARNPGASRGRVIRGEVI